MHDAVGPRARPVVSEHWQLSGRPSRPIPHVEHAGSMLRGAFGHALKDMACHCPGDAHQPECLYQQIFEPLPPEGWPVRYRDCPPAFVLTPPQAQFRPYRQLDFAVTLLGPAVAHSELIWAAWQLAAHRGFGGERISVRLRRAGRFNQPPAPSVSSPIRLRFTSPLLLKRKQPGDRSSRALGPQQITPADLFIAVHRRLELTRQLYGVPAAPLPPLVHWLALAGHCQLSSQLHEVHYARHSSRQHQRMPLYGLCGDLILQGPLDEALGEALALGQWLHIGGKTALGQGGYRLESCTGSTFNEIGT